MTETVINKINNKIKSLPKGKIIFIKDFANLGNDVVVRQSLKRLVAKEKLVKVSQGIYYKPKNDYREMQTSMFYGDSPSFDQVIKKLQNWR